MKTKPENSAKKKAPPVAAAATCSSFALCSGCTDGDQCQAGELCVTQIHEEAWRERQAYIKAGICRDCGACSPEEAEGKCRPSRDITDEWTCGGDELWNETNSELNPQ